MAKKPRSLEIRSFQVGFGDCFLLSFDYADDDRRHVLIDFGTTGLPKRGGAAKAAKPSEHMPAVANEIRRLCGGEAGRLTAVVATHRHADHVSGFATDGTSGMSGVTIRDLKPRVVVQPWTEDPDAAEDATKATLDSLRTPKSFVAGLAAMQDVANAVVDLSASPPAWMSPALAKQLEFVGRDNISNVSAVENLIAMGKAPGSTAVWAHHGSNAKLGRLLPGVQVSVLGPPDLTQSEKIRKQRSKDPDQFWHLLAGGPGLRKRVPLSRGIAGMRAKGGRRGAKIRPEVRWFRDRLTRLRGQQMLEIVTQLDDQMNNTSLILLIEVLGKKLLFPGDAQLENWSYALEDAPDKDETKRRLAEVDFYKVGHHGSLNATPKKLLWEPFAKRGADAGHRLASMISTMPGKHGKTASETEVPRRPLLAALKQDSDLLSTDDLRFGANPVLWQGMRLGAEGRFEPFLPT